MEMGDRKAQEKTLAADTPPRVKAQGIILVEGGNPMDAAAFKELETILAAVTAQTAEVGIKARGTTSAADTSQPATEVFKALEIISVVVLTNSNLQRSDTHKCSHRVLGSQKPRECELTPAPPLIAFALLSRLGHSCVAAPLRFCKDSPTNTSMRRAS